MLYEAITNVVLVLVCLAYVLLIVNLMLYIINTIKRMLGRLHISNDSKDDVTFCKYGKDEKEIDVVDDLDDNQCLKSVDYQKDGDVSGNSGTMPTGASSRVDQVEGQTSILHVVKCSSATGSKRVVDKVGVVDCDVHDSVDAIETSSDIESSIERPNTIFRGNSTVLHSQTDNVRNIRRTILNTQLIAPEGSCLPNTSGAVSVEETKEKSVAKEVVPSNGCVDCKIESDVHPSSCAVSSTGSDNMSNTQVGPLYTTLRTLEESSLPDASGTIPAEETKEKSVGKEVVPSNGCIDCKIENDVHPSSCAVSNTGSDNMSNTQVGPLYTTLRTSEESSLPDASGTIPAEETKEKSVGKEVVPSNGCVDWKIESDVHLSSCAVSSTGSDNMSNTQVRPLYTKLETSEELNLSVTNEAMPIGGTTEESVEEDVVSTGDVYVKCNMEGDVLQNTHAVSCVQTNSIRDFQEKLLSVGLNNPKDSGLSTDGKNTPVENVKPGIYVDGQGIYQMNSSCDLMSTNNQDSSARTLSDTCSVMLDFYKDGHSMYSETMDNPGSNSCPSNMYDTQKQRLNVSIPESVSMSYSDVSGEQKGLLLTVENTRVAGVHNECHSVPQDEASEDPGNLATGVERIKQVEQQQDGVIRQTASLMVNPSMINALDVSNVNLEGEPNTSEKVVVSLGGITVNPACSSVIKHRVQSVEPVINNPVTPGALESKHNVIDLSGEHDVDEKVVSSTYTTIDSIHNSVGESQVQDIGSVVKCQLELSSSSFSRDTCLGKDTSTTMDVKKCDDDKPDKEFSCSSDSECTDDSLPMVGIGSYFIDQMIRDIDSSANSNKKLSDTLEKSRKQFSRLIEDDNEKLYYNLIDIVDLIGGTIGLCFINDSDTRNIVQYVMKQANHTDDDMASMMLMRDEKCLFRILVNIVPVFNKVFFGKGPVSENEWKLIGGLLSMRKGILQGNIYFQRLVYYSTCICRSAIEAIKQTDILSKQYDEIKRKIEKCVAEQEQQKDSFVRRVVNHFSKSEKELLSELDEVEKKRELVQEIRDSLVKEKEALLRCDAGYMRYLISRIVFDCWRFDDQSKKVLSNVRSLVPYILGDGKGVGLVKYLIPESKIFSGDTDALLSMVKAYHATRQYNDIAKKGCQSKEASTSTPTNILEDVRDLIGMEWNKSSGLTV
ncbi:hypothetical protein [Ehrlichia ruminantium]|uniref:hypothetical protein n=1 Tax=Ehrlichia ruminantium TaxID=779 RepID=UPI00130D5C2C|nr:hypothetical protein [Ehrlichia ruminantium]